MSAHSSDNSNNCFLKDILKDVTCDGNDRNLSDLLTKSISNEFEYKSELEYILLRLGLYDFSPINVKTYKICDIHYNHLITTPRRNHCSTCKIVFGQKSYSTSDLRHIPRTIAYGIWQDYQVSVFDDNMCGGCRRKLEKNYVNTSLCKKSQELFDWLYDDFTLYTPSTISSSLHSMYEQNEEEQIASDRKQDLKDFLVNNGYNARVQMTNDYQKMRHKSRNNFLRQIKLILLFILKILAPNDFRQVWNDLLESEIQEAKEEFEMNGQFGIVMNSIANAYNNANHWSTRRQILSIIASDVPVLVIQQFIPDVTVWKIKAAREQAFMNGQGSIVNINRTPAIRYKDEQIAHFVQYILSPHITTDLPFGEKQIKLSSGDTLIVPNTIRNMIPSRIINAYKQYCEETDEDFQPLNDTCLFEILNGCSASTRKSLQGLDYFAADGANAFDILQNLCNELATFGTAVAKIVKLKNGLNQSRNYLKNDFKMHIQNSSEIADHCASFALSDILDSDWQEQCDHLHHLECNQCLLLKNTLKDLRLNLETCSMKDSLRSRYLYRFDQNAQMIWDWKAHLLRCVQQDLAKVDILDNLPNDSVMILLDWAMKWLPMKFREAQRDFFAKRGLPWHITYVIRAQNTELISSSLESSSVSPPDRLFQHRTFLHVFDQCTQNSRAVISILVDVLKRLKNQDPGIKYAYLRSDNAGCYHSSETLLSIKQIFEETGIFIRRFDFSDPQSGKSACDRMAAVVKCNVRRHMNEKNNVENSQQFVDAAKATKHLSSYACHIVPHMSTHKATSSTTKNEWTGVTMYNNIEYKLVPSVSKNNQKKPNRSSTLNDEIEVTTSRSYKIGKGKKFLWSYLNTVKHLDQLVVTYEPPKTKDIWMNENTKEQNDDLQSDDEPEEHEDEYTKEEVAVKSSAALLVFDCPDVNCVRQFRRHSNLQIHLTTGTHQYPPNKLTLLDKAKLSYQKSLESVRTNHAPSIQNFQIIYDSETSIDDKLKQGWALFNRKTQTPFSEEQIAFLTEKYNEGEQNGLKWEPSVVADQMMTAMKDEEYIFEPTQCLSSSQIKSYFSRETKKRRQQSQTKTTPRQSQMKPTHQYEQQENEISDDDSESLHHVHLMQSSIDILKTTKIRKNKSQPPSTSSPSTIRKIDSRSNDDLTKHLPSKRISKK